MGTDEKRRWQVLWSGVLASLVHRGGDTHPDGALGHFCVEVTLRQTTFQHQASLISRCPQGIHGHPHFPQSLCRHLGHWVGDRVVRSFITFSWRSFIILGLSPGQSELAWL